jgi:hypothetical protein
VLAQL